MQWYDQIENVLKCGKTYSHKELIVELESLKPDLSDSTYHWTISRLVRDGRIIRLGYDAYSRPGSSPKREYHPLFSDLALDLMNQICEKYPYIAFTVFERLAEIQFVCLLTSFRIERIALSF